MKFLVDENLSKALKFIKENPEYENVKPGEADDKIIQRAFTDRSIIMTKDIKLALNALIAGVKVWYFDVEKNMDYRLIAQVEL